MTLRITTAALVLAAAPVFSGPLFAQTSGVSHPDSAPITSDDVAPATSASTPVLKPRPSAAIPATPAPATTEVYGAYVPYTGPKVAGAPVATRVAPVENPEDAMIVVSVPERAGELREGTLLLTPPSFARF